MKMAWKKATLRADQNEDGLGKGYPGGWYITGRDGKKSVPYPGKPDPQYKV